MSDFKVGDRVWYTNRVPGVSPYSATITEFRFGRPFIVIDDAPENKELEFDDDNL